MDLSVRLKGSDIDDIQLKVIEEALEESKRLDWEDDVREMIHQEARIEAQQEAQVKIK